MRRDKSDQLKLLREGNDPIVATSRAGKKLPSRDSLKTERLKARCANCLEGRVGPRCVANRIKMKRPSCAKLCAKGDDSGTVWSNTSTADSRQAGLRNSIAGSKWVWSITGRKKTKSAREMPKVGTENSSRAKSRMNAEKSGWLNSKINTKGPGHADDLKDSNKSSFARSNTDTNGPSRLKPHGESVRPTLAC